MAFPLIAALAAGGALKGYLDSNAQRKAEQRNMMANATAIEMSPWTGMNPGFMAGGPRNQLGSVLGGAVQGGTLGAMFGQQFAGNEPMADSGTAMLRQPKRVPWLYMDGK